MPKADLAQRRSERIGPGISKHHCATIIDRFLNAIEEAAAAGDPARG